MGNIVNKSDIFVDKHRRDENWPILCGNFLVEKNFPKIFSKDRFIKVSNAITGTEISRKSVYKGRVINCSGGNLLYSGKSLFLADPVTLLQIRKIDVKNLPVWDAITIGNTIYYIDGVGHLFESDI